MHIHIFKILIKITEMVLAIDKIVGKGNLGDEDNFHHKSIRNTVKVLSLIVTVVCQA